MLRILYQTQTIQIKRKEMTGFQLILVVVVVVVVLGFFLWECSP